MHDVLEGSLPYEVKEMLNHFIKQKIISQRELTAAMESFPYLASDARNKPVPITATTLSSSDHKLKQTGKSLHIIVKLGAHWEHMPPPSCGGPVHILLWFSSALAVMEAHGSCKGRQSPID